MISDLSEMPLFHMERLLFLCICIYVYLYVCRQHYVLYVSPRFLETRVTFLLCVYVCVRACLCERETFVFLSLFI